MEIRAHTWSAPDSVSPRLILSADVEQAPAGNSRFRNALWVLDYSKAAMGWTRVGSTRAAWRRRGSHVAHLYPPLTPYWEDKTRDVSRPAHSAYILFIGGEQAGLSKLIVPRFKYARLQDRGHVLQELLDQLCRIGQSRGDSGFALAHAVFWRIVDLLLGARHLENEDFELLAVPERRPASLAEAVDAHFRLHLRERIRLEEVAASLHVSLSALAHRFRVETGMSPFGRLIEMRINMAKGLLLKGQRLDLIAAQTGFCDAYHLSKTFSRLIGLSPRKFVQGMSRHAKDHGVVSQRSQERDRPGHER